MSIETQRFSGSHKRPLRTHTGFSPLTPVSLGVSALGMTRIGNHRPQDLCGRASPSLDLEDFNDAASKFAILSFGSTAKL